VNKARKEKIQGMDREDRNKLSTEELVEFICLSADPVLKGEKMNVPLQHAKQIIKLRRHANQLKLNNNQRVTNCALIFFTLILAASAFINIILPWWWK